MRIAAIVIFGAAAIIQMPAQADDASKCRSISNKTERLNCYDAQYPDTKSDANTPRKDTDQRAQTTENWIVNTGQSKIDDSPSVSLMTTSLQEVGRYQFRRDTVNLLIRCRENTTSVILVWPIFLGTNALAVTTRLDNKPARTRNWSTSTNYKAVGLWEGQASIPFIKEMMDAETLTVRLTPYGESPEIVTFNIGALSKVIGSLRAACKW